MFSITRFSLFIFTFLLFSCRKDEKIELAKVIGQYSDTTKTPVVIDTSAKPASLEISFLAIANTKTLVPESKTYTNSSQDIFTVSKLNFYYSKVQLRRQDGTWFEEPESYHLIKYVDGKKTFTIENIPDDNYTEIRFLIGVDSIRNVSGSQTGDLALNHDMFWDWNSGYIFFKLEGAFSTSVSPGQDYAMHIGGFEGPNSCLQTVNLTLPVVMQAKKGRTCKLLHHVIVDEIFTKPMEIGFEYYYNEVIKGPKIFRDISLNYADMFTIAELSN